MKKILPYPLLFVSLVLFWLLLNGFTRAQFLLGIPIALLACHVMTALEPKKNHVRSVSTALSLLGAVSIDILHSNIAVTKLILSRQLRAGGSGLHHHGYAGNGLGRLSCDAQDAYNPCA